MTAPRARLGAVQDTARLLIGRDVRAAAEENIVLSKDEEALAPQHVREAASELRRAGDTHLTVDALDAHLAVQVHALISTVDPRTGRERPFVSRAKVRAAKAASPALGARVMKAWEITTGRAADVDGIAEAHVRGGDPRPLRIFATEAQAVSHRDPRGRSVTWLVKTGEDSAKATFVWGRNDLWAQRFEVGLRDGALVVTAEH